MNLLIVTHVVAKNDGQGRVNYEVVKAALAAGHSVTLLASRVDEALARHSRLTVVLLRESRIPSRLIQYQSFAIRAGRWIRAHRARFDVVQVNGFIAWARADVNAIHFVHSGWYRSGYYPFTLLGGARSAYQVLFTRLNSFCERWAFNRSRVLVPVSQKVGDELCLLGIARDRIQVIHNGVDNVEFSPAKVRTSDRARFALPDEPFMLLFAGDLRSPRKNLDTVLRAMVGGMPNVHLAIAGGTDHSPYPAMAESLGVASRVHFLGAIKDMPGIMRCADAFVFPSRYEAMSLVMLEALASGLPVVTVHTAGGAEVISKECGIVLPEPDDADALRDAITLLASEPVRASAMGAASARLAATLSWQVMAGRYLALFDEIAKTDRSKKDGIAAGHKAMSVKS